MPSRRASGVGEAPPSPACPADPNEPILMPPALRMPAWMQTIRMTVRPRSQALGAHQRFGDVWQIRLLSRREPSRWSE